LITQALLHFPGIGPKRLDQLRQLGIVQWSDFAEHADALPKHLRGRLIQEAARCQEALANDEIAFLAERLHAKDKWRVLTQYLDQTTFFDIETDGLDHDSRITVIACWHRGQVHTFVEHRNLDDFLSLLDDVRLLASFNGNSFDVPRVLDAFHIPALPCPHLDLRWLCFHRGHQGGLKQVAYRMGIHRPLDLSDADGALAVRLWMRWQHFHDEQALSELLRYCASDAVLLHLLALRMSGQLDPLQIAAAWELLPTASATTSVASRTPKSPHILDFGSGSLQRLRARRSR
jgi:uncharacterized protein YprB with RNaseH-like and TPR domain